jgi:hypothetical protein
MIAVVVLALLMVPMFYVVVQRLFGRQSPTGEGPDANGVPRETADTLS